MSRFAARSVPAALLLSLAAVLVVTPSGVPQPAAHPSAALAAHIAPAPAQAKQVKQVKQAQAGQATQAGSPAVARSPKQAPIVVPAPKSGVTPRAAQNAVLSLTALAWSQPHMDATAGTATDTLTWTITDSTAGDNADLSGTFQLAQQPGPGGHPTTQYNVNFPNAAPGQSLLVATTATQSTYSYTFQVPRYSSGAVGTWAVTSLSMSTRAAGSTDFTSDQLLAAFPSRFTADELADTTPPAQGTLTTITAPYAFAGPTANFARYQLTAIDAQSGALRAQIVVRGPGGVTRTGSANFSPSSGKATLSITFPVGSVGTWTVTEIDLTDAVGNFGVYTGLSLQPVVLTDDSVIKASNMFPTPDIVDDWTTPQTSSYRVDIVDPVAAITSATLVSQLNQCQPGTPTLPGVGGGTLIIPLTVPLATMSCDIVGLAVTDAAGNVSVYGFVYGEHDTDLPDVRALSGPPPQATNFRLSTTRVPRARPPATPLTLTVDVSSWEPGVTSVCVSSPDFLIGSDCASPLPRLRSGTVTVAITILSTAPPGTYRLQVTVGDADNAISGYGAPANPFTITVGSTVPGNARLNGPPHGTDGKLR